MATATRLSTLDANRAMLEVEVVNRGSKQTQATLQASIAGRVVCTSPRVDLLVNAPPARVLIEVPRPEFGDLVQALSHATTLYGEALTLTATTTDGEVVTATWSEEAYDCPHSTQFVSQDSVALSLNDKSDECHGERCKRQVDEQAA